MPKNILRHKLYWLSFLVGAYLAFAAYASSSFLATKVGERYVESIYLVGALFGLSLSGLSYGPKIIARFGNLKTLRLVSILAAVAAILLGMFDSPWLIAPLFIAYYALGLGLRLISDIFLETASDDEHTGSIRGIFLTMHNTAWLLSPLLAGLVISQANNGFSKIYIISGLFLLPVIYLALFVLEDSPAPAITPPLTKTIHQIFCRRHTCNQNLWPTLWIDLTLNFFYAGMVIYLALFLIEHGMAWSTIGVIFTVMLLPFVLFEWIVGFLADRYFGEQEILVIGLFTMGVATLVLPFLTTTNLAIWAITLFITRVGASFVEVAKETYLFKQLTPRDTDIVSLFRATGPISYIAIPIIGLGVVHFFNLATMFILLAIACFTAIYPAILLVDSK